MADREDADPREIVVIALGGNALVKKGQIGSAAEQFGNLKGPIGQIACLCTRYRVVITHGNGPQAGNLLLQEECCDAVPRMPLEVIVAETQGMIGYMIESTLDAELSEMGAVKDLVSLLSYVVVDPEDPAFKNPSKPIGPVLSAEKAAVAPYPTILTARGYRRVVASPKPVGIVELREIKKLIDLGFVIICCGGGGIPVVRRGRAFHGIDAVIDKDLTSARLATDIGAASFIIATDVEGVFLDYNKDNRRLLPGMTIDEAGRFTAEGHFPPGSMGPKIEGAVQFVKNGGKRAVITSVENLLEAVEGKAGTEIVRTRYSGVS